MIDVIQTSVEKDTASNIWRAVVWEIDESGAKSVAAISECATRDDALRSALDNYHTFLKESEDGAMGPVCTTAPKVTLPAEHKIELTPFTRIDWYGWAGAERFPNGDEPLIAASDLGVLILDAEGIGMYVGDGSLEDDSYHLEHKFANSEQARVLAGGVFARFADAKTVEELVALAKVAGFTAY